MGEKFFDALSERTSVAENLVKLVGERFSRRRNLDFVGGSEMGIGYFGESLEKKWKDLEEKEKEFEMFREGKKRKLDLEEQELTLKREEFLNDVRTREDELNEKLITLHEHSEWLEMAQNEVQSIRRWAWEKWTENQAQEQNLKSAQESLAEKEKKVDDILGKLDGRMIEVEKKEKEFDLFVEGKNRELELKEKELNMKREVFSKEVKLAEEKFGQQAKLRQCLLERLQLAEDKLEGMKETISGRFKEIENRGNVTWESVAVSVNEADLIRESMEKKLEEFEKMKREFNSFTEEKMKELVSKEQQMCVMIKGLVKDAMLRDEQLTRREKLGHELLKRLELAKGEVEDLNKLAHEKFKEIRLKENELSSSTDWIEKKLDEADLKGKELKEKEKILAMKEDNVIYKENELQKKINELDLKESSLGSRQKELDVKLREVDSAQELNDKRLEEIHRSEKNLDSLKVFTKNCFNEHLEKKKQLQSERDLVAKRAKDLEHKEKQLEDRVRELELEEKQMRDYVKGLECKQLLLTYALNARVKFEKDESVDVKFEVRMDGKNLQMFLNDPGKNIESMSDEISVVLHLSSDPAKLVLDAIEGFYPPHLREGDLELNVRRSCIILLQQLIKMSPKIRPSVREEANELANTWKSKLMLSTENPLEVWGFLHLLAAYDLTSYFDKDEILSFVTMVAEHAQTPELLHVVSSAQCITDHNMRMKAYRNKLKAPFGDGQSQKDMIQFSPLTPFNTFRLSDSINMSNHNLPEVTKELQMAEGVMNCKNGVLLTQASTSKAPKANKRKKRKAKVLGPRQRFKRKLKEKVPGSEVKIQRKGKQAKDKCFRCGEYGHWMRNCPKYIASATTNNKPYGQGV